MAKNSKALQNAKLLRKNLTTSEKIIWEILRNRKILNLKFRRQMPLVFDSFRFVADFYCAEKKIIIEIDGSIHEDTLIKEYDQDRELILKLNGYKIIRIKNNEVYDLKKLFFEIKKQI